MKIAFVGIILCFASFITRIRNGFRSDIERQQQVDRLKGMIVARTSQPILDIRVEGGRWMARTMFGWEPVSDLLREHNA